MSPDKPKSITTMLQAAREGDADAFDELYARVYDELRRLARAVRRGKSGATLNTTALVHEAYVQLLPSRELEWVDRKHFFAVAARAMRQVLVQAARRKKAAKRGGGVVQVAFDEAIHRRSVDLEDVIALDEAMNRLDSLHPRQARIVEFRFFAGLNVEETADALSISAATVKRDWRAARAWLTLQLAD